MISIMTYALLIAFLVGAASHVVERAFAELRWPRRWLWMTALVASVSVPFYSIVTNRFELEAAPASTVATTANVEPSARGPSIADLGTIAWPPQRSFDSELGSLWAASSVLLLLVYVLAYLRVRRARRTWRSVTVDDTDVLVADHVGPAVFGFLEPRIVVPRWLLEDAEPILQALVLRHEREHVRAGDQRTLLAALLLLAVAPWNLPLWWQLRRLRLAIEIDCDARVTSGGADPAAYSEALLLAQQRRSAVPLGVVALTEPVSSLERRIRLLLAEPRGARRLVVALGVGIGVAVLVAACAVNAPELDALRKPPPPPPTLPPVPPQPGQPFPTLPGTERWPEIDRRIAERYFPEVFTTAPPADSIYWVLFENDGTLVAAGRETRLTPDTASWEVHDAKGALVGAGTGAVSPGADSKIWPEATLAVINNRYPRAALSNEKAHFYAFPISGSLSKLLRDQAGIPVSLISVWPGPTTRK